jgi:hypothetical protein
MANATDQQVQSFVDQRVRPRAEQARNLAVLMAQDIASIDDIYNALNVQSPTWADNRTDGPPHLALPSDVLAFNTFLHDVSNYIASHGQYAVVQKLCVRNISG